jgi:glycosyltransferase involved in cell wall biosynthesis
MTSQGIFVSTKNIIKAIDNFIDIEISTINGKLEYRCSGIDPQCQFSIVKKAGRGWYEFEVDQIVKEGKIKNAKLYLDSGIGYNETEVVNLPRNNGEKVNTLIYSPRQIRRIRFDPSENSFAVIEISNFFLRKLTASQLFRKIYNILAQSQGEISVAKCFAKSAYCVIKNDNEKIKNIFAAQIAKSDPFFYQNWIAKYDSFGGEEISQFKQLQTEFKYRPLVSVLLPTYNTPILWLKECINSVIEQVYDNWELCIADDNSTSQEIKKVIKAFSECDKRIKYIFRDQNGHIAISSNTALSLANGEFVCLLDHDDKLASLALYRIIEDLNKDNSTDFFYSDEDKIDEDGERSLPFFKPDWSPTLFYSQNYITHLACIRRTIIECVKGFTEGLHGSQDYDLFLRIIAGGATIKHLPYILYHWRLHKASTSMVSDSKPYAHSAGKKALENYLFKKYPLQFNKVDDGEYAFTYLPRFYFDEANKISIIIPTKDKLEFLKPCIESILAKSVWKNYEIVILNNNSIEDATFLYFKKIQAIYKFIKVIDAFFDFNWSKLNNLGCKSATGKYLIFLNNDVSVITPEWMERLCECASLPNIAAVGASLLYEDNTLQHAGVTVGMNGWADHIFKGMHVSHFSSPYISNEMPHNVLAVTGACLAIKKSRFEELGMFDESFTICGSDVELGIRAHKANLFNAVQSNVKLYHYESKSRGSYIPENDFIQSAIKYEPFRTETTDPFFNPNLSLTHTSPICKS